MQSRLWLIMLFLVTFILGSCQAPVPQPEATDQTRILKEHQGLFTRRIEKIGERVYLAIGYGLANSAMVAVEGGKVIIDTTESITVAAEIKAEFDKLVPGPVLAVIYTHTHPDHVLGTSVFVDSPEVPIWAHELAFSQLNDQFASLAKTLRRRGAKQFGEGLDRELAITNGIGPFLRLDEGPAPPMLYPNHTFVGQKSLEIGGVTFELYEAPGETNDQILVWLPEDKILFPGDNIYQAWPNLYSTRGVPPRPVRGWIKSLDLMRTLKPVALVPGHTGPIQGEELVYETLTIYRDAIAFVHDSVIRLANQGLGPDDIVEQIKLPDHLRDHPYLQELYGKVSWSARGIYDGYLGWFDGNPASLAPLHPRQEAQRLVKLLDGREQVLAAVRAAVDDRDMQWAAELADRLLALDPSDRQARNLKADALWWLGQREINLNARCYLLTSALELRGQYQAGRELKFNAKTIQDVPIATILGTLPERIDPQKTAETKMAVAFDFTDSQEKFVLYIRQGVGEVARRAEPEADLTFSGTEADFKAFLTGDLNPIKALATKRIRVDGGLGQLLTFQSYLIKP